jgi:antitoxin (DNA-binding transcriptional repressor) of toxin-antitoxin stability system
MTRMTATDAARGFSDVLNRVAAGEEVEVLRNGAPVAVIGPPRARLVPAAALRDLLERAPGVDGGFAKDVRAARAAVGPPSSPWAS